MGYRGVISNFWIVANVMDELYHQIVINLRNLMARILEPKLDLVGFLDSVAKYAKELSPDELEARVYEVDFNENRLYLQTSTKVDIANLEKAEKNFNILPQTITGDAIIENRFVLGNREEGYAQSRFAKGEDIRAAFPIEFYDPEMPEGRTKYVLVVDKKGEGPLDPEIMNALRDFAVLAGLAISIKEIRDQLSKYYEDNRNLVLSGRHAASIGHDIRSLNVGVGGYLTLALRYLNDLNEENYERAQKYVFHAQDNAGQVESLLRNFSMFNQPKVILNLDTDLKDAVQRKVESLQDRMDFGQRVKFDLDLPPDNTGFNVDRDWFGTVIENLVKNSVEACRDKTVISISLNRQDNKLQVMVEDDCGGIPPADLPKIFRPFITGKKTGQGLGLANAKKVVEDHGGRIRVENGSAGAIFIIEFHLKAYNK